MGLYISWNKLDDILYYRFIFLLIQPLCLVISYRLIRQSYRNVCEVHLKMYLQSQLKQDVCVVDGLILTHMNSEVSHISSQ